MERKNMNVKAVSAETDPENIMKAISTTTNPDNIRDLQETLKSFGIQIHVFEDDVSWSDSVKILVFVIPAKKGE